MQLNDHYFLNPAHLELARERYFAKDENGMPVEEDIDEVFCRVVNHLYKEDNPEHAGEALRLRREKKIIDAGRPLAQAGTKTENMLNCFVIGFGDHVNQDGDTREAISELKRKHFNIQAQGGGTGINFSVLRPNGSICRTTQSRSSGTTGFITDISYQSFNVQQGGNRSGANMGALEDWHPDLYDFITKKSRSNWENIRKFATIYDEDEFAYFQWAQPYPWQMFNVSVFVSDKFMGTLASDPKQPWVFSWKGTPWHLWEFQKMTGPVTENGQPKTITVVAPNEEMAFFKASAKIPFFNNKDLKLVKGPYDLNVDEVFGMICQNAWEDGCPGIVFEGTARKFHNGEYFNPIESTNPCVTDDTWVMTQDGPKQVCDLINTPFVAIVDGRPYKSKTGFFATGNKETLLLKLQDGFELKLTPNHQVLTIDSDGNDVWKEAGQLGKHDNVVIHNHKSLPEWNGDGNFDEGYVLGLLVGDGTITNGKAILSTWSEDSGSEGMRSQALLSCASFKHRSDFNGWSGIKDRGEYRLCLKSIYDLANDFGINSDKIISKGIESASKGFYVGFLRGFFDSDGSVQGTQKKGVSIRLWQANRDRLIVVQRMLTRLGIKSQIYFDRKPERTENIKGTEYNCAPGHELVVSNSSVILFDSIIGFSNINKSAKLKELISNYKRSPNRDKFFSKVEEIVYIGKNTVYDATVDDIHAFDANGIYVHNCAEQVLPKNAVCCLASIILPTFFANGEFLWDEFASAIYQAVRGLDNIISLNKVGEPDIDENSLRERRIGLGTTGVAELLILAKLKYSSQKGRNFVEKILEFMRDKAYEASIELAKERGPFPAYEYKGLSQSEFFKTLPEHIRNLIRRHGLRNVTIMTQAPTGTTGTMVGFSTGCEPYFAMCFKRNSRIGSFSDGSPAFLMWLHDNGIDYSEYDYNLNKLREKVDVPDYFEEAHEIHWMDHLRMQAVFAKYVDSSVSKTINLPKTATLGDVKSAYVTAYKMGIKSTTVYRDGSKQQILEQMVKESDVKRPKDIVRAHAPKRPTNLECDIHHTSVRGEKWTVLVGLLDGRPYEVFCAPQDNFEIATKYKKGMLVKNGKGSYYLDTGDFKLKNISSYLKNDEHRVITRLLSTCLRHGVPMPFISDQMAKTDGTVVDFSKAIMRVLKRYGDLASFLGKDNKCAICGSSNVVVAGGCPECLDCGISKCG